MDSIQVPTHFRERRRVAALRAGSAVRSGGGAGDESRPREDVGRVLVGLGDTLPRILEYAQNTHRIRIDYAWTIVPAYSMHILCVFYEYSVSILCTFTQ